MAVRQLAMLARTLRLTPRSRTGPRATARRGAAYKPSFYDTMDLSDENNKSDA